MGSVSRSSAADSARRRILNGHWFLTLGDARRTLEEWRTTDNRIQLHSALGNLAPEEFAREDVRAGEGARTQEVLSL